MLKWSIKASCSIQQVYGFSPSFEISLRNTCASQNSDISTAPQTHLWFRKTGEWFRSITVNLQTAHLEMKYLK